jgi:hypothetical protein
MKIFVLVLVLVLACAAVWAACPVRPLCPTHHVEMDENGKTCDDTGVCTITFHCPAGGEDHTVKCRGGE